MSMEQYHRQSEPTELHIRVLWTCVAFFAHASMALMFGSLGPSFLDLLYLVNASVETGSLIFTSQAIGGVIGGLTSAWVYTKFQKEKVLTLMMLLTCACLTVLLPFSQSLELMCIVAGLRGFGIFISFTGCALICIKSWRQHDGSPLLQALHCAYSAGGVIAPFIVSPFLGEKGYVNQTSFQEENLARNTSNGTTFDNFMLSPSKVYFGFLIVGGVIFLNFLFSLGMLFSKSVKHTVSKTYRKEMVGFVEEISHESKNVSFQTEGKKLGLNIRILFLAIIALYFMFIVAVETLMQNFLSTFVTRYLSWTKVQGAQISSVFWASFAVGRFLGIFAAKVLTPWKIIAIDLLLLTASILTINFTLNNDTILWICVSGSGIFVSGLYASGCSLVDEDIMRITGKTYAVFLVSETIGSVIYPILLGYLIDNFSAIWFIYLAEIMCLICVLDFILITLMIRKWGRSTRNR